MKHIGTNEKTAHTANVNGLNNESDSRSKQSRRFIHNRRSGIKNQCCRCKSDYMKFAVNNFCVDCQQEAEFVFREHPKDFYRLGIGEFLGGAR